MNNLIKKELYIVFDFKTPNGYLPFCYTKKNIINVLKYNLENKVHFGFFNECNKILTKELHSSYINDQNLYIIVIDDRLKHINLNKILSPKLYNMYNESNNFHIIYHEYEISEMYSLI